MAKAVRLIALGGKGSRKKIPPLLLREGWSVRFDAECFDAIYREVMDVALAMIKPGMDSL